MDDPPPTPKSKPILEEIAAAQAAVDAAKAEVSALRLTTTLELTSAKNSRDALLELRGCAAARQFLSAAAQTSYDELYARVAKQLPRYGRLALFHADRLLQVVGERANAKGHLVEAWFRHLLFGQADFDKSPEHKYLDKLTDADATHLRVGARTPLVAAALAGTGGLSELLATAAGIPGAQLYYWRASSLEQLAAK